MFKSWEVEDMVHIQADDQNIQILIENMVRLIKDQGGWVDPALMIRVEDGDLSLTVEGHVNIQEKIISIPQEILIPRDGFEMSIEKDQFMAVPKEGALSEAQKTLLDMIFKLFNHCDKVNWTKKNCPYLALENYPELLEKIIQIRERNEEHMDGIRPWMKPNKTGDEYHKAICEAFIKTRVLGQKNTDDDLVTQMLMPLVDFLNHDYDGSAFQFTQKGKKRLQIMNKQPILNSRECFAFYNLMDAHDSFLSYYYVDEHVHMVRSVGTTITFADGKSMKIRGRYSNPNKEKVPDGLKDLQRIVPHLTEKTDEHITVTYIPITMMPMPHATRRILFAFCATLLGTETKREVIAKAAYRAEKQIIDGTIAYYKDLLSDAQLAMQNAAKTDQHILGMVVHLARTQLTKLYKYVYDPLFLMR